MSWNQNKMSAMTIFSLYLLILSHRDFYFKFFFVVPPHLNPELKNLSVPLNSTFETDCFKRGDPPVYVNWTKDGKALDNKNTLVIKRMTLDHGGFYECAAENQVGKVNISFWIDVTGKSKSFYKYLQTVLGLSSIWIPQ